MMNYRLIITKDTGEIVRRRVLSVVTPDALLEIMRRNIKEITEGRWPKQVLLEEETN